MSREFIDDRRLHENRLFIKLKMDVIGAQFAED